MSWESAFKAYQTKEDDFEIAEDNKKKTITKEEIETPTTNPSSYKDNLLFQPHSRKHGIILILSRGKSGERQFEKNSKRCNP